MSPLKAFVMSALTLGVYDLVFWWRHWRTLRTNGRELSVFPRTIFAVFCAFEFKNSLSIALLERNQPLQPMLASAPLIYFLAQVGDNVFSRIAGDTILVIVISGTLELVRASALYIIQKSANQVLEADGYQGVVNRGASAKTYLAGLVGLSLWALALTGRLFPE